MYNEKKELEALNRDNSIFEIKNSSYKNEIANKLLNDNLGTEIHRILNNPIKVSRFKLFMFNIKKTLKKILDSL